MADQTPLVSTVAVNSPDALEKLATAVQAAAADGTVLPSEVNAAIAEVLAALSSDSDSEALTAAQQLAAASTEIASFIKEIQQSIFEAKASSPQGLLLAGQLQAGLITQAQFQSAVGAIAFTSAQLQSAVAGSLPEQSQKLVVALASSNQINQLAKLATSVTVKVPDASALLDGVAAGETAPKTPPVIAKLDGAAAGEAEPKVPPVSAKLKTDQTDNKLGNSEDFLTKMIKIAAKAAAQNLAASANALISLRPQPKIMSGARAVVKLNGAVAVLCNNVQFEVSTDWSEVRGIDELVPNDLAPTSFSVKGSMSIYRVPNQSPVSQFLQQDMFRGVIWPYTTIEIRDKRTDEIIMQVKRAAITSRSEAYTKGQLTSMNLSFVGIGFRDEKMPELLPDKLTGQAESGIGGLVDTFKALTSKLF